MEAVEIDDAVVSVATKWFNLTTDDQLVVHVADGLQFVSELSQSGKYPLCKFTYTISQLVFQTADQNFFQN